MFGEYSILAIIPARGGSKGVPDKNIRELGGHPLLAYTVEAARKSKHIDAVVMTTDSERIARVAELHGAEAPFLRPEHLAADTSRTIDALVHAVGWLGEHGRRYDAVVLLQPTSPLRTEREIDEAIETFFKNNRLGLASVAEVVENPVLTRRLDSYGILHPILPVCSTARRQDMPKFYHVDGAIYINKADDLTAETSLNDNPIAYVMPKMRSVDIDSLEDFYLAERYLQELRGR